MASFSVNRIGSAIAVFATVALVVLALPPGTAQARSHSCAAKRSTTVQIVGNVRIFTRMKTRPFNKASKYKAIYACSRRYGHRFELRTDDFPGEDEYENFVVAGRFLGYVMTYSCGACDKPPVWPFVLDLKYGHTTFSIVPKYVTADLGPDCSYRTDVCDKVFERFLLRRTGSFAVAYQAIELGDPPNSNIYVIEKHELGAGLRSENISILDRVSGTPDLRTLALSGNQLSWSNAGQPKSATIK